MPEIKFLDLRDLGIVGYSDGKFQKAKKREDEQSYKMR